MEFAVYYLSIPMLAPPVVTASPHEFRWQCHAWSPARLISRRSGPTRAVTRLSTVTAIACGRVVYGSDSASGYHWPAGRVARLAIGSSAVCPWHGDLDAGRRDLPP